MRNLVNELFVNSGRPQQGDNRRYSVKALNKILSDGIISISVNEKGYSWTNKTFVDKSGNLRKFNIVIKGYGVTGRYYDTNFDSTDLLKFVAQFIQSPLVKDKHLSSISGKIGEHIQCEKCNGLGTIEAFNYYCNGICFDCYGSGTMFIKRTITI
jgi:hypothetical protein